MKVLFLDCNCFAKDEMQQHLNANGYDLHLFSLKDSTLNEPTIGMYDIVIIEMNLNDAESPGFTALRKIGKKNRETPVLIISEWENDNTYELCYKHGGYDLLSKPLNFDKLLIKVDFWIRHGKFKSGKTITFAKRFAFDVGSGTLYDNEKKIFLSKKEQQLLELLLQNRGFYVSSDQIIAYLWNGFATAQQISTLVFKLRKKLTKECIRSSRNLGYMIG